jgi:serine protease inhibitor
MQFIFLFTDTNIVFSPIGIQMAFSMLLLGADAETKVELKRSLEIKMSAGDDEWQKAFAVLLNSLRKDGDKMFVMATRIYLDTKVPVDNRYKQALQKIYHLDPAQVSCLLSLGIHRHS